MGESPILASHYMLNDILLTIDKGNVDEVRRICEKYVSRYKSDDELFMVCNRLLFEKDAGPDVLSELRSGIVLLAEGRKAASMKKGPRW